MKSDISQHKKFLQIFVHIIVWVIFLGLLTTLVPQPSGRNPVLTLISCDLFFVVFFYLNFFILVPRFFVPRKYVAYATVCTFFLIMAVGLPSIISMGPPEKNMQNVMQYPPPNNFQEPPPAFDHGFREPPMHKGLPPARDLILIKPEFRYIILIYLLILTLSLGLRILLQWQQAVKEKISAELAYLKAQINPHFFFNTLNSIYALSVTNADRTPYAIEKFSDIMRFVIYESQNEFVPLGKKIEYIGSYIELQKLRLSQNISVNFSVTGDPAPFMIAPMILMPFIESAFRSGLSTETKIKIDIGIDIENSTLKLLVRNTKNPEEQLVTDYQPGLENAKKRLDLIYPGKYKLLFSDSNIEHVVSLTLDLI
jgi:hypothetical protein